MQLTTTWRCLGVPPAVQCDETGTEDRDAERHTKATKHSTITSSTPAKPERRPR